MVIIYQGSPLGTVISHTRILSNWRPHLILEIIFFANFISVFKQLFVTLPQMPVIILLQMLSTDTFAVLFPVYFIFHVLQLVFLGYRSCCLVRSYHQSLITNLHCQYLGCAYVNSFLQYCFSNIASSVFQILVNYFFKSAFYARDTLLYSSQNPV